MHPTTSNSSITHPHDDGTGMVSGVGPGGSGTGSGGSGAGAGAGAGDGSTRVLYNGTISYKKKPGRKPKVCFCVVW